MQAAHALVKNQEDDNVIHHTPTKKQRGKMSKVKQSPTKLEACDDH